MIDQVLLKYPDRFAPGSQIMQQVGKRRIAHLEGVIPVYEG